MDTVQPKYSAIEIQQQYYESVGDADWELYKKQDRSYLLQKIAVAICGPPTKEGNLIAGNDLQLQGYEKREEEITLNVFGKICEQAKYSHNSENILISIIRVVCVTPSTTVPFYKMEPDNYWVDLHKKKEDVIIFIFHVFSVRKCIATNSGQVKTVCRVFIDHDARVYQTWEQYLENNNLPKCVMVVPENGEYKGTLGLEIDVKKNPLDVMPIVKCSVVPSPALGLGAKVLSVTDTASFVANISALAGIAGALFVPAVAPVAVPTAIGVGVVTGIYGIARSTASLIDRSKHEQTVGIGDSQARASWINILVSTAGISATGAAKLLSWAAASGTNVKILMNAVSVLQFTNLGTGFIGVANSLSEMIIKYTTYDEKPTTLEVFQFTTSALFLGLGVMSNQTAQEIVQDAQAKTINEYRDSLPSNTKRRMFDKTTAETRRVQGTIQGNADVIKALNKIENKNEFFAKLARINKQMNKNKIRVSLSPDGNPLFNNQHKININELHGLGRSGRNQLFSNYGPADLTTRNAPTRLYTSSSVSGLTRIQNLLDNIPPEEYCKIGSLIISLSLCDQKCIDEILSHISSFVHNAFLLCCVEVIDCLLPKEIEELQEKIISYLGCEEHNYKIEVCLYVFDYIKSLIPEDGDPELCFANILKEFVKKGRIEPETIGKMRKHLMENIRPLRTYDDPHAFINMTTFRKMYKTTNYTNIEAGKQLKIGSHDLLIKSSTVENLEEWLAMCSQEKCDLFMNLCFKIISLLDKVQVNKLIEINFDEDLLTHVSYYLLFEAEGVIDVLTVDLMSESFLLDMASNLKDNLMNWRALKYIRKYQSCDVCCGIRYLE